MGVDPVREPSVGSIRLLVAFTLLRKLTSLRCIVMHAHHGLFPVPRKQSMTMPAPLGVEPDVERAIK